MLEVIYRRADGLLVRSLAHFSHIGELMIGEVAVSEIESVLSIRPYDAKSMALRDWMAEFRNTAETGWAHD